ncbi:hypothetical protein Clacol_004443 [Clathrus columnatus]|uniref:Uncharacterized protein n=1 Tax=Clathrus columnatus TaxID=1419009 RepID=A0AAV5A6I4_9AGAM|nr:hypothetical protein Clacol_004443 [Clathrus columnatus]
MCRLPDVSKELGIIKGMGNYDNDGNLPEDCILPASPTIESAPPKWKNTRWGPNPPTKQTQVRNRKRCD